ncbi:hypothetical protein E4T52_08587 [Aureobasidium sp. EXF-3400]|nr:hypothetical protein E4T51_07789 [Aureobasidium sp. EXF-12344]KAI4776499.1 hypothetical protein E4T52_08587 [Aureobasidium sp. EXF-3400]
MALDDYRRNQDNDVRLVDFLDDKLQAFADFDSLDSLLDSVKAQQDLLKQQLVDARNDHNVAQQASDQHATSIKQKGAAFQRDQQDLDRRLQLVTQSETSDDALQKFESSMAHLRKLDMASGYAEMLQEVDTLRQECSEQLGKSDKAALTAYKRLSTLATGLQPLSEAAEGAAPHLVLHVLRTTYNARTQIEQSFAADFEKTLTKMGWPKQGISVPPGLQPEWDMHIAKLIDLQKSELVAADVANSSKTSKDEPAVLLPPEIMVRSLELRFNYHFSGDRPTNRLDKPEYFLNHVLDLISSYSPFFQANLQPQLLANFRGSDLALIPAYIDATSALITALIPMLQNKLRSVLPQVSEQPQLLSNLMHEVMTFDATIQEEWNYTPLSPATVWRGLAHYVLEKEAYFSKWLNVERDFALARYEDIISDRASRELDYDSVSADSTKPTKAAVRVNDLLETITERYKSLSSFSQKFRFFMDIQIEIFDRVYRLINGSLQTFMTNTTTVGRAVNGVTKEQQAEYAGVKGMDRLCRVFGSAEYLEKAMRDWSDDVFFLEIWEELQYRAANRIDIKGDLNMIEIAAKTNAAINSTGENQELEGALFEQMAAQYRGLRVRSEKVICDTLIYDMRDVLRPYARINPWASLSAPGSGGESSLTAELDPPLTLLDTHLAFLSRALSKPALRRICRVVGHSLQITLWDSVLLRHTFSTAGASQFMSDFRGLCSVFDRYLGAGTGRNVMQRLDDGLTLLDLPVRGEIPVEVDAEASDEVTSEKKWGLFEVERRVFMDNETARDVLEEMGLEVLTESDARAVLGKRVELSS